MNLARNINHSIRSRQHLEVIKWFQTTFQNKRADAIQITVNYPALIKASTVEMSNVHRVFLNNGFTKDTFTNHPWMFSLTEKMVKYKLEENSFHKVSGKDLPLINISNGSYPKIVSNWNVDDLEYIGPNQNRVSYFANNLNCDTTSIINILYYHMPLITLDIHKVVRIMDLLKEHHVDPIHILTDMYIFRHNADTISDRLNVCKQHEKCVKPWLLRCPEHTFKIHLKNWTEEQKALLNHKDKLDYLASELEVDQSYIKLRYLFDGSILNYSTTRRLKKVIDYLKNKDYSSKEIVDTFRILGYSLERTVKRIMDMETIGRKPTLTDLLPSETVYNNRLMRYKERVERRN